MIPAAAEPPPRVSVAVMAHSRRARWAQQLAADLDAPIVWDTGHGIWDTGRRALLAYDPQASHHLVVQDDAIVCRDLLPGLAAAAAHAGQRPIGLYIGCMLRAKQRKPQNELGRVVRAAGDAGASWISAYRWPLWGVASAHPVGMIDELVGYGDRRARPDTFDRQTRMFYRYRGIAAWYTHPSLVDHRTGRSLLRNGGDRKAWQFLGENVSALSVDWSTEPYVAP